MSEMEDWEKKYRDDPRPDDELFALVLIKDPDTDDQEYWQPISALQHRLPMISLRTEEFLSNGNEKARDVAATIFGQKNRSSKWAVEHCVQVLLTAISRETAAGPLAAMVYGLGHLHDERSIPEIAALRQHEDCEVRFAVTHALHGFENETAIQALVELSADWDGDIRNWATFNLGSRIDADSPLIRDALAARLNESDEEIRGEAIVGLARRGDVRLAKPLMRLLHQKEADELRDWTLMEEAVDEVAERATTNPDTIWLSLLVRARQLEVGDHEKIQVALDKYGLRADEGSSASSP
jgi:hypothetical protein